jgi:hypothetical protein
VHRWVIVFDVNRRQTFVEACGLLGDVMERVHGKHHMMTTLLVGNKTDDRAALGFALATPIGLALAATAGGVRSQVH